MEKIIKKIVLTGGPCAGKTSALARLEEDLTEKGYHVLIASESATELIKGGIKPFGDNPIDILKFQELILQYQLQKEAVYQEAANATNNDKIVIVHDRGILDNKAYITNEQFKQLLNQLNLSELELMDNYDMIIHLVTAADGAEKYYTLDNNNARTETVEEAIQLDKKTANAWVGHNNLKIIDNSTNFDDKLNQVVDSIHNLLGNPISIRKQKKYKINLNESDLTFLDNVNTTRIDITQTYLIDNNDNYERRLRKKTINNQTVYYFTVQKKEQDGLSKIVTDKKITEKEYLKLLSIYQENYCINKTRYTFIDNKQYFRLDIFENKDFAILEIDPTNENKTITIPQQLKVEKEVTNDEEYQNSIIAKPKQDSQSRKIKK